MKATLKSTGEVIYVEPCVYNGTIVSYSERRKDGSLHIYLPKELDFDSGAGAVVASVSTETCSQEEYWRNVEVQAAVHALSACIIAGKKDAAQSAVYYAKQLVEELRK